MAYVYNKQFSKDKIYYKYDKTTITVVLINHCFN